MRATSTNGRFRERRETRRVCADQWAPIRRANRSKRSPDEQSDIRGFSFVLIPAYRLRACGLLPDRFPLRMAFKIEIPNPIRVIGLSGDTLRLECSAWRGQNLPDIRTVLHFRSLNSQSTLSRLSAVSIHRCERSSEPHQCNPESERDICCIGRRPYCRLGQVLGHCDVQTEHQSA